MRGERLSKTEILQPTSGTLFAVRFTRLVVMAVSRWNHYTKHMADLPCCHLQQFLLPIILPRP
ncbi:uncharacterized protein BO88DRAFT_199170 [Aspergillus vadensis CBS 113365]|uniref:Uncharacterized protein n=1 Tax=Aspergillus vadensis (strain CBS 113365 / IMI 142717 / IBT 24658) TaxID=1448311 RepID=A0A319AT67_ASPVC|nr:hypothetical protein BO88DRAFT_199170 [Aspergillus vadensis CBS 113365]PYH63527.1 hypothetical protein BO88DRAFT_199170 [Aspergillus vadensis CBS 113365]